VAAAAALAMGAVVVRELARPRPDERARLIDWAAVRRTALRASGETGPTHLVFSAADLGRQYDEMAEQLRPWIGEALGVDMYTEPFPRFQVVDRRDWVDVNIELFQNLLRPVLRVEEMVPASALTDIGRAGLSRYLGVLLGFLSQRVLGQYDPVLLATDAAGPTALYLVEPNIERWEANASVPSTAVRQWLVLHECTHAWQFEAHPWLREHMNGLIRELIANRVFTAEKPSGLEVLRALTIGARSQWAAVNQIQAVMSLLEGFSNFMMRRVGRAHLEHFDVIDEEFQRRQGRRNPAERAFFKITGLDLKMQQYVLGERFCDSVLEAAGMPALMRVWDSPEVLPTLAEIRDPHLWVARTAQVGAKAVAKSG